MEWQRIEGSNVLFLSRGEDLNVGLVELAARIFKDIANMADVASINLSVITAKQLEGSDGCLTVELRDRADRPKNAVSDYIMFSPHIRSSHLRGC